jgi:hypothetical protein
VPPTTITRLVAVHFCPAYPIAAAAIAAAAASWSASGSTMAGFCPPISHCTGMPRATARRATACPAPTEPVNETASVVSTIASPAGPRPVSTVSTSAGRMPANSSASRSATADDCGAGLRSTVLP